MVVCIVVVRDMVSSLESRFVFGAGLDLDLLGIELDEKTLIPGLAVVTSRAKPLAGFLPLSIHFLLLPGFWPSSPTWCA